MIKFPIDKRLVEMQQNERNEKTNNGVTTPDNVNNTESTATSLTPPLTPPVSVGNPSTVPVVSVSFPSTTVGTRPIVGLQTIPPAQVQTNVTSVNPNTLSSATVTRTYRAITPKTGSNTRAIPTPPPSAQQKPATVRMASVESNSLASKPANVPQIRVKAIESLKELNQSVPSNNSTNAVKIVNGTVSMKTPNLPLSVKVSTRPVLRPAIPMNTNAVENRSNASDQPVKLWNDVIQKNAPSKKQLELLVITNGSKATMDESIICLKPTKNNVIENATDNSSSLKIGQVYESVSDEFVEDLLIDKTASVTSPSPMLDTLVKEITTEQNKAKDAAKIPDANLEKCNIDDTSANQIRIINDSHEACFDFRCNICLHFSETFNQFKEHMLNCHQYSFTCQICHEPFITRIEYNGHIRNGACYKAPNSKRSFICIVDPPVILMKNEKVFAFRCKHCSLAFKNQRNYVQHAQRHAKLFRCKRCTGNKAMVLGQMRNHLKQHEIRDFVASQK